MAADFRPEAGILGAAADHAVDICLVHGPIRKVCAPTRRAEEVALLVGGDAGPFEIGFEVILKIMMTGHLMVLAAFFVQARPGAAALHLDIPDTHTDHGPDAGKGVDHDPDERPSRRPTGELVSIASSSPCA